MEDEEHILLRQLAAGDEGAFTRLVGRYGPRVLAIARRFLGHSSDAEDVAQQVFIAVWRARDRFDPGRASFSTWIYRITANACLDHQRKKSRWRWLGLDQAADISDGSVPSDERMELSEAVRHVRADLLQLPERQRLALLLVLVAGRSIEQTADILGVTVGAAEQLIVRARRALRQRRRERNQDESR